MQKETEMIMKKIEDLGPIYDQKGYCKEHFWDVEFERGGKLYTATIKLFFDNKFFANDYSLEYVFDKAEEKSYVYGAAEEFFDDYEQALQQFKAYIHYKCGGIAHKTMEYNEKHDRNSGIPKTHLSLLKEIFGDQHHSYTIGSWDEESIRINHFGDNFNIKIWAKNEDCIAWSLIKSYYNKEHEFVRERLQSGVHKIS
ncbi:hypothetical protein RZN22_19070 [Bacillaceae bacterium S4-13-58]